MANFHHTAKVLFLLVFFIKVTTVDDFSGASAGRIGRETSYSGKKRWIIASQGRRRQ